MGKVKIEGRQGRVELTMTPDGGDKVRYDLSAGMAEWIADTLKAELTKIAPPPLPEKIAARITGGPS